MTFAGFSLYALFITITIAVFWLVYIVIEQRVSRLLGPQYRPTRKTPFQIFAALEKKMADDASNLSLIAEVLKEMSETGNPGRLHEVTGEAGRALRNFHEQVSKLRAEEEKKHWSMKGLAILGDLKRSNSSLEQYATLSIQTLVKYMGCSQGRFFMLDAEESALVLLGTYAYDKTRFTDGRVSIDAENGLLGQCIAERDVIYLSDVPSNYIKITSGLGHALPRALIILPLKYRDRIYGVVEMASFEKLSDFHIDFAQRFCEGLAAEVSGLIEQRKMEALLQTAQSSTEQLKAQEEELRNAMERMSETQEALVAKESILQETIYQIENERARNKAMLENCGDAVISFDECGRIDFFNNAAGEMLGYSAEQIVDQKIQRLLKIEIENNDGIPRLVTVNGQELTGKTEITVVDSGGNELSLLVTAAHVNIRDKWFFTLLAQRISVELF